MNNKNCHVLLFEDAVADLDELMWLSVRWSRVYCLNGSQLKVDYGNAN